MIVHNEILCIELQPLITEGIASLGLWQKWIRNGAEVVRRGGNGRTALLKLETIPQRYQDMIKEKFGDPAKAAAKASFIDRVVSDQDAFNFYKNYRLENGKALPEDYQATCCINASVLNAIKVIYDVQLRARKAQGKTMRNFWKKASETINGIREQVNHTLPTYEDKLAAKYKLYTVGGVVKLKSGDYQVQGYEALISKKFCNDNTQKITPEIENWMINEMAQTRVSVEMMYHQKFLKAAQANGWRTDITAQAFRDREQQPRVRHLIELKRHGRKAFRQEYGHTFKLAKPMYSNDIWVSDGTALNWYYNTGNGVGLATTYMIMDARSNKFLGWATKAGINKENFEMQLDGYRMALRNAGAKPYQLLFDNQGGHKKTESRMFYNKIAHVSFPTRAYRPSGKAIERAFGKFQQMKLAELPFWSGFGRPSHADVNYRPNMEEITKNIDNLPTFDELVKLFDVFVNEWNELDYNGTGSPNAIYNESRNPEEQPITLDEIAEMFWQMGGPKKYQSQGISIRIKGEDKLYEVYTADGNVDFNFRLNYLKQNFLYKYDPDGEFEDVELYTEHATLGLQRIATASPKRENSRSVKYLEDGEKEWMAKQMKAEEDMMDDMDKEMVAIGYNEEHKWNSWRDKITPVQPTPISKTLYGEDEGTMETIKI